MYYILYVLVKHKADADKYAIKKQTIYNINE